MAETTDNVEFDGSLDNIAPSPARNYIYKKGVFRRIKKKKKLEAKWVSCIFLFLKLSVNYVLKMVKENFIYYNDNPNLKIKRLKRFQAISIR